MSNKDAPLSSLRISFGRLLRRPLGLPIFELFWAFLILGGILVAIVIPLVSALLERLR